MQKIRIHGRGGQGAVTSGQILAMAAFHDGLECQTFPMFGVERAGAPVTAFVRMDKNPIHIRSQVYTPDIVLVLDASLIDVIDVTQGLAKNGLIIVNSNKDPKDLNIKGKFDVRCVDATQISLDIFKRPVVNTPILGAFAAITRLVTISALKKAIHEKFAHTKGEHISDLNKKAVEKVYSNVK